jgi:hypothetical protein
MSWQMLREGDVFQLRISMLPMGVSEGRKRQAKPNNIKTGRGCPNCAKLKRNGL